MKKRFRRYYEKTRYVLSAALGAQEIGVGSASGALSRGVACGNIWGLRVKMCVWLGVSRGLDLAFLNAD